MRRHGFTRSLAAGVAAVAMSTVTAVAAEEQQINIGGVEQAGTGSIRGTVKFEGEQKARKPIRMAADPRCAAAHSEGEPPAEETFVFGDNDTLQNVFVYVSGGLEGKQIPRPTNKPHLDQEGCVYVPHVLGVVVNQDLEIINSDNTLHNVKCEPETNQKFNEGMPVQGMKLTKRFTRPEMAIPFKCDVHAWMNAYVHVMEHPYFAVTQQEGTFEIRGLPPGQYEVSFRHELRAFAPDQEKVQVTVAEGEAAEVTVTYSPRRRS